MFSKSAPKHKICQVHQGLDWAARGVAMGQAPDDVAAVCHEVTTTVYQDGAARILETLL